MVELYSWRVLNCFSFGAYVEVRGVVKRFLTVVLTTVLPLFAFGQQNQKLRDRDPDLSAAKKLASDLQQASIHRGPFYLFSRVRIADAGFSDAGGVPTGDNNDGIAVTVEAPQRLYFVPRKKTVYSVEFVPGYSWFQKGRDANQWNYLLRGDGHFLLNHLYLDLYALRADQLRAHVADLNRVATVREDEVGVAGEVKYSSRTSGLFTVRLRDTEYPTRGRYQPRDASGIAKLALNVLDREERNARVSLQHKTFPRTSFFVSAEASDYDFVNHEAHDSLRTFYGGGLNFDAGRTQMRVEAGGVKLDFDDPSQPDYSGVNANLRLSRGNGRWTYTFGADRDLGFSIFLNNSYFVSTAANAGADYVATRRLTLHAQTAAERDEYDTPVFGRSRTDDIWFSSVGFTYAIRRARVGLDVGWYERNTTAFGDEGSGIRYVLRLSLTP